MKTREISFDTYKSIKENKTQFQQYELMSKGNFVYRDENNRINTSPNENIKNNNILNYHYSKRFPIKVQSIKIKDTHQKNIMFINYSNNTFKNNYINHIKFTSSCEKKNNIQRNNFKGLSNTVSINKINQFLSCNTENENSVLMEIKKMYYFSNVSGGVLTDRIEITKQKAKYTEVFINNINRINVKGNKRLNKPEIIEKWFNQSLDKDEYYLKIISLYKKIYEELIGRSENKKDENLNKGNNNRNIEPKMRKTYKKKVLFRRNSNSQFTKRLFNNIENEKKNHNLKINNDRIEGK